MNLIKFYPESNFLLQGSTNKLYSHGNYYYNKYDNLTSSYISDECYVNFIFDKPDGELTFITGDLVRNFSFKRGIIHNNMKHAYYEKDSENEIVTRALIKEGRLLMLETNSDKNYSGFQHRLTMNGDMKIYHFSKARCVMINEMLFIYEDDSYESIFDKK